MENKYDSVMVGGGLAGITAAISAARLGSKVALVQNRPVLGGNSSSEIRVRVGGAGSEIEVAGVGNLPWARETGIIEELFVEDRPRDPSHLETSETNSIWDLVLYEKVRKEKNIALFLNTHAREANTTGNLIEKVVCTQLGSEKTICLKGKIFVDATGDGTVAKYAGAEYRMGREAQCEFNEELAPLEADGLTMGNSLSFHARDVGHPVKFEPPSWAEDFPSDRDLPFRNHSKIHAGYWWIEVGNPPFDTIGDNEKIRDELIRQLLGVWDHIKNHGDHGADNYVLDWIGMVPGKRESRRIIGDYILNEKDIKSAKLFPDRVAYGGWWFDLHTPGGILAKDKPPEPAFAEEPTVLKKKMVPVPFAIPFRCLYSKNIKNLMMAGRDISVTHVALGPTRQMGTCAVIGQAVGTAVYLCSKYDTTPRNIHENHVEELQQLLLKQDCYIPMLENQDGQDRARKAKVTSSSTATLKFLKGQQRDELDVIRAQLFPVTGSHIDSIRLLLESRRSNDTDVSLGLRQAKHIWDFAGNKDLVVARGKVPAHSFGWVRFQIDQDVTPHKLYWVHLPKKENIFWTRCDNHPVGTVSAFRFLGTWKVQKCVYSMTLNPPSTPYEPLNTVNGSPTRPEKWTNIWISDAEEEFPQTIEVNFGKPVQFNTVCLTFDTNLNKEYFYTPPLYRAPECVRDYTIEYLGGKEWRSLTSVKGNYQSRRIHTFRTVVSSKIKVTIHATNGSRSAHIYGIRVYDE